MSDENKLLHDFFNGGWLIPIIGGIGMVIRLLLDGKTMSYFEQIKRIVAAILCSTIAWFILEQTEVSSLTKAISYGVVGVVSPEIIAGIVALAKKFSKKPQDYIPK